MIFFIVEKVLVSNVANLFYFEAFENPYTLRKIRKASYGHGVYDISL